MSAKIFITKCHEVTLDILADDVTCARESAFFLWSCCECHPGCLFVEAYKSERGFPMPQPPKTCARFGESHDVDWKSCGVIQGMDMTIKKVGDD